MTLCRVVATVTLVGLGPGAPVWADDADPQIARWLRGGQLRRVEPEAQSEVETLADAIITLNQAQAALPGGEPAVSVEPQPAVEPAKPRRTAPRKVSK